MATNSFKDLIVWQKAGDLTADIHETFSPVRDYSFRDQIQRASISIMNNIAEGHARRSDKSFRQFLLIAKGSCAEVESMLIIASRLGYISTDAQAGLINQTEDVGRLLSGFVRKLSAQDY